MLVLHRTYGPTLPSQVVRDSREDLAQIFTERAQMTRSWRIFLDPSKLQSPTNVLPLYLSPKSTLTTKENLSKKSREAILLGADIGQIQVGQMLSELKVQSETRAEQKTIITIQFPNNILPTFFQGFGRWRMDGTAYYSLDRGLENFSSNLTTGMGPEVIANGFREENSLVVNQSVFHEGKKIVGQKLSMDIQHAFVPSVSPSPFKDRNSVQEDDEWDVAMLDLTSSSGNPKMISLPARVVGRETIQYHHQQIEAFHVVAGMEDRKAEAFYNAQGKVLKERWTLAQLLPLTLVRDPE